MTPEETDHLFSVYEAERQDDQNGLVTAFAIATAGITYVVIGTAYIQDHYHSNLPSWIQFLAPAIPVALFGFLVLNVAATRMRSVHLQRLEAALSIRLPDGSEEPSFHTDSGIVFRPDNLLEVPHVRIIFGLVTFLSYGIIGLTLTGFTWIALLPGPWQGGKIIAAAIYGVAETIEVAGMAAPLFHPRFRAHAEQAAIEATPIELARSDPQRIVGVFRLARQQTLTQWAAFQGLSVLAALTLDKLAMLGAEEVEFVLAAAAIEPSHESVIQLIRDRHQASNASSS
jgi:hypothetical protein